MTDHETGKEQVQQSQNANSQIARAAGIVMLAMAFGQIIGLLSKILISHTYGTSAELDAFYAANRLAEMIYLLVAGGALGSAFIPVFTGFITDSKQKDAWRLAASIGNLITLVLIGLSGLVLIFAEPVVRHLLAPGFSPEQQELTVRLLRLLMPTSIIFGVSGLVMGILNAHQRFLLPALAPSLYQVGIIFGVMVFAPPLGIFGLAWGALLGSVFHLLVQVPQLIRLPHRSYEFRLNLKHAAVREVLLLMLPRLLGVAVVQLNFWLNTVIASNLSEGSLTAINVAFPLMLMPQTIIAQAVAIAALPTFSAQAAKGQFDEMRASLAMTLRSVLLLAIPATMGLILLRRPLVAMLYEHGEFTAHSTELVSWALLWYAAGLIGHCVVEITSRAFYALHDTRTPVIVGVITMSLNLLLSLLFSWLFEQVGWLPHGGLALANSLATLLEMIALMAFMRKRLDGLNLPHLLRGAGKSALATLMMSAVLWGWLRISGGRSDMITTLGGLVIGGGVYLLVMIVLRIEELSLMWGAIRRRLFRQ
ncbi:MAG: murein biosynthesis integral membrane protein MurJ [Anaerolineaceae bacterium]|nr:murein biosynthesis integral membrane protein MurJ [Anaerolineaceae bacterium]